MKVPRRIFTILLLMICCSCDSYNFLTQSSIKQQAKSFGDEVVPRIVDSWNAKELIRHVHPEFLKSGNIEQTEQAFFLFMKLGKLLKYDRGQTDLSVTESRVDGRKSVFFDYVVKPEFEGGRATITLRMVKEAGEWKIVHFSVDSESLKTEEKMIASRKEDSAKDVQLSREKLEEYVQSLSGDDIVQLRRGVDRVFELARIYEKEGNDPIAMELYEKALLANPSNLSAQLRLAGLLLKNGRKEEGASRLRYVRDFAQDEALVREASSLMGNVEVPPRKAPNPALHEKIELVLVPIGSPSAQILSELRSALQDRIGMKVSISEKTVELGNPDRKNSDRYISEVFGKVQQEINQLQRELIMREYRITNEDLNSSIYRAHFVKAYASRLGKQGQQFQQQFSNALESFGESGQYDIYRLAEDMKRAFPIDSRPDVKCYLGVTQADLYAGSSNFLYGGTNGICGVVSYFRFTESINGATQDRPTVVSRTLKQALSSAGFIIGMPRCSNPYCARAFPMSLAEHDAKSDTLCDECRTRLDAYLKDPRCSVAAIEYLNQGVAYSRANEQDKAVLCYRKALENDPAYALAYEYLGMAYTAKGDDDLAMAGYRKALELDPDSWLSHANIGAWQLKRREFQSAVEHLVRASRVVPDNSTVREHLGGAYYGLEQWHKAVEQCEAARKLGARSSQLFLILGASYGRLKRFEEAAEAIETLIALDPKVPAAYYNLGLVLVQSGKKDRAVEQFKKAIETDPSYFGPYYELGRIYGRDGLLDDAVEMFQAALRIKPDSGKASSDLGYTYYLKKDYVKALELYEKAVKLDPGNGLAHYNKAMAHFAGGQYMQAVEAYDKAAGLGYPGSPQFRDSLRPYRSVPTP